MNEGPNQMNSAYTAHVQLPEITLRDWFAGLALQGLCASESDTQGYSDKYMGLDGVETFRSTMYPLKDGKEDYGQQQVNLKISRTKAQFEAEESYKRADAMLAEREKVTK